MAVIGNLIINMKTSTTQLAKGFTQAGGMVATFTAQVEKSGTAIQAMITGAAFYAAGRAMTYVVGQATALGEQSDRSRIVFGDFAGDVIAESERMAAAFGISRAEFIRSASAFGAIFKGVGYDAKAAAQLSVHFVKLATDLSSFAHIPVEEAMEKIQSGLAGQVRPLREVGVFMSEDAIKAKAAAMGIAKLGTEMTEAQKVQARVAFITEQLKDAQGNLALTAGSVANQTRSLTGRLENLAQTVGTALLPIVGAALSELTLGVGAMSAAWEKWTDGVVSNQVGVVNAVGETAQAMGWLQKSIGFVADEFQVVGLAFKGFQSYVTWGIARIVEHFGFWLKILDRSIVAFTGLKTHLEDLTRTYTEDLDRLSGEQWKVFQKDLAKPPASDEINQYFDNARKRIEDARKQTAGLGTDISKLAPAGQAAEKTTAPKFASAMTQGSKEATNAILRSRYGEGIGKRPEEETAKNTRQTVTLLERLVANAAGAGIGVGNQLGNALAGYF